MAINLKNADQLQGAVDALRTILTSRKRPIIIEPKPGAVGGGPQLNMPKNSQIKKPDEPDSSQDPNNNQNNQPQKQNSDSSTQPQSSQQQDLSQQDEVDNSTNSNSVENQSEAEESEDSQENSSGSSTKDSEQNSTESNTKTQKPTNGKAGEHTETPEEKQARLERIKQSFEGPELEQDLADIQLDTELRRGETLRAKKRAADALIKGSQSIPMQDFSSFSADLFKAISSQIKVSKHKEDTFKRPNPTYAGTNYLMPGKDYFDKKDVPVLNVYFDQSGSWGKSDIEKGIEAIAGLKQFERRKKLKIKLFFFANNVYDNPEAARAEGGTRGFSKILKHLADPATKATNAIIISDSDIEYQTNWMKATPVELKGCVWFVWKGGSCSRKAIKYLKGKKGTFQYQV